MAARGKLDCKSESELLLLVEGINDCHAIFQLMRLVRGADPVFGIHECGGDGKALDSLAARLVDPRPKQRVLGLVLDSDPDGVAPGEAIRSRLDQIKARAGAYYSLPHVFPEDGLIAEPLASGRLPRLGVWLMPDNKAHGMFEDLLMQSLSARLAGYTEAAVKQAKADGVATFRDAHLSKAVVRTYMAWQDPPDVQGFGAAIGRGAFENIEAGCKPFVQWLERLFGA